MQILAYKGRHRNRVARGMVERMKKGAVKGVAAAWQQLHRLEQQVMGMDKKKMYKGDEQQEGDVQGGAVVVGADGSVRGTNISSIVGSMMTTSEGVGYDGQPFGCAPLHPAM